MAGGDGERVKNNFTLKVLQINKRKRLLLACSLYINHSLIISKIYSFKHSLILPHNRGKGWLSNVNSWMVYICDSCDWPSSQKVTLLLYILPMVCAVL